MNVVKLEFDWNLAHVCFGQCVPKSFSFLVPIPLLCADLVFPSVDIKPVSDILLVSLACIRFALSTCCMPAW